MTSGEKLKAARKKAGLNQRQLADRMGCSVSNISQFERGDSITFDSMARLAHALGVQIDDIWSNEEVDEVLPVSYKETFNKLIEASARISENLDSLLLDLFHQLSIVDKKDIICHAASLVDAEKAGDDSQLAAMKKIFK